MIKSIKSTSNKFMRSYHHLQVQVIPVTLQAHLDLLGLSNPLQVQLEWHYHNSDKEEDLQVPLNARTEVQFYIY